MQLCFPCIGCGKPLVADTSAAGQQVQCLGCGLPSTVPDSGQALPVAAAAEPTARATEPSAVQRGLIKVVGESAGLVGATKPTADEEQVLEVELEEIKDEEPLLRQAVIVKVGSDQPPYAEPVAAVLDRMSSAQTIIGQVPLVRDGEYALPPLPPGPPAHAGGDMDPGEHIPTAVAMEEAERDKRKFRLRLEKERAALAMVSRGMLLVNIGAVMFLVFAVVFMLAFLAVTIGGWFLFWGMALDRNAEPNDSLSNLVLRWRPGVMLATMGFTGLLLAANVFLMLGKVLCCQVPRRTHGRGAIVRSLIADAAGLFLMLAAVLLLLLGPTVFLGKSGQICQIVGLLFGCLAVMASLLSLGFLAGFLQRLAEYLNAGRLADEALDAFALIVGLGVVWPFITVGLLLIPPVVIVFLPAAMMVYGYSAWLLLVFGKQWIRFIALNMALRQKIAAY